MKAWAFLFPCLAMVLAAGGAAAQIDPNPDGTASTPTSAG